ncbi:MAG: transposase, partial [bacterium]|nr:transposase [bacterium]
MHSLFPNAILIPDRFHFVLQPRNSFDKTRIKLICKNNPDYRKYKKYWKLLFKNEDKLDDTKKFYSKNFKTEVTQKYIVTYLINKDPIINSSYNYYQGILKAIKNKDKNKFINIIHHLSKKQASQYINKTTKTLLKMEKYLLNSFDYDLSNGI